MWRCFEPISLTLTERASNDMVSGTSVQTLAYSSLETVPVPCTSR